MTIDLEQFALNIKVRPIAQADFDQLVELQNHCFPGMKPWTKEQIASQLKIFPEGQICIEFDGRLVASSSSLILDYANYSDWHDWAGISDKGFIRNHDPEGDSLYGIEMMVHPEFRGLRLARRLYDTRKDLCRHMNLARMIIGGRVPGFASHKDEMTVHEYARRVLRKEFYDSVLTTQVANGFLLRQLVPDYLPSDEDSSGFATILEWPNLDYVPQPTRRSRHAVEPVRVSLVQYPMRPISTWVEFQKQCEFFIDVAADQRSDFVLFPELFTLQLLSIIDPGRPGSAARALAEMTPKYLELFTDFAVRFNINIIGGTHFVVDNEHLYNVSYLFRRDGTLARQDKIHVTPNEQRWWGVQGGNSINVLDTDRGKIAIAVCYDIEFPELGRVAADNGANIIFVPYNTNDRAGHLRVRYCAQARAVENQVYVVTSGCVGALPQVENADIHYAQSAVLTPSDIPFARDGIAIEASPNLETVLTCDVDIELLRKARKTGTVRNGMDRRHDLYKLQYQPNLTGRK